MAKKEYCGVVGIYGHKDAARLAYLALYALQHRGEESTGIVSFDGRKVYQHKGMGLVGDIDAVLFFRNLNQLFDSQISRGRLD